MILARRALPALAALLAAAPARAQSWPDRPMRFFVGYPPGGPSDIFARLLAAQMGPRLGQNVVVENRVGGGAVLASEAAARTAASLRRHVSA